MSPLPMSEVLLTIHKIPSLPVVITELLASMGQEDTNVEQLAAKIAQDQGLTAKTLRLANSSFYGMAQQVTTLQQAIAILGFRTIRCLATTTGLMAAVPQGTAWDATAFWRHGIAAAVCARELANTTDCNPDHAYTAALLHDIGRLVLATQFPSPYAAALAYQAEHACPVLEAEQTVLGLDHTTVGHAMTRHWNFPIEFQDAIADHHAPRMPDEDPLTTTVRMANALAHGVADTHSDTAHTDQALAELAQGMGLEDAAWNKTLKRIRTAFEGAVLAVGL